MAKYAALVSSASEGAVTTGGRMAAALGQSAGSKAAGPDAPGAFAETVITAG
jgi:hypothetical protein